MPKDYPPPSKAERDGLVKQRAQDVRPPAPAPRPPSVGALVDASAARRKQAAIHDREQRISSIDQALSAKKSAAKDGLSKVKDSGRAQAAMRKAARRSVERAGH